MERETHKALTIKQLRDLTNRLPDNAPVAVIYDGMVELLRHGVPFDSYTIRHFDGTRSEIAGLLVLAQHHEGDTIIDLSADWRTAKDEMVSGETVVPGWGDEG